MKEIFIIYDKDTGFLNGVGRIDRAWDALHQDGSTISERISGKLKMDATKGVIYLPNQDLPDPEVHKIREGIVVLKTNEDKLPTQKDIEAEKINNEIKAMAVASLKTKGELPQDYKE